MSKYVLPVILFLSLFLYPSIVQAQDDISLINSEVEIFFPGALVFKVEAEGTYDITRIRLNYTVDKMNYANVVSEAWPQFTPSTKVKTQHILDMRRISLPPGTKLNYRWIIEDKIGNAIETSMNSLKFEDSRYQWQSLSLGQITLLWYEGDESFARELMSASHAAIERLTGDTGARLERPIKVYIYASSRDLQGSMVFPQEWTGGVAFTEYGVIAIGVSPGNLDWGKDALAHELGHMVTHQIAFSPFGTSLPVWLDEGLAMHAESQVSPTMVTLLHKAASQDALFSVRSLSSPFSAIPEKAYLSYAQSQSIVDYLINTYGHDKVLEILNLLEQGNTCDEALLQIYGFDQDGLDKEWRSKLMENTEPAVTKTLHPVIIGTYSILAIVVIIAMVFILRKWAYGRREKTQSVV